jgi:hypothetical protein
VAGAAIIVVYVFNHLYGTTPEEELTPAEGVPTAVEFTKVPRRGAEFIHIISFKIGSFTTEYASDRPKYDEVVAAVESGDPIRVWISTKRETLFAREGWVPLYKLEHRGKTVLDYQTTVAHKSEGKGGMLWCAGLVIVMGAVGLFAYIRARKRQNPAL